MRGEHNEKKKKREGGLAGGLLFPRAVIFSLGWICHVYSECGTDRIVIGGRANVQCERACSSTVDRHSNRSTSFQRTW
jgi:hypothetical protein